MTNNKRLIGSNDSSVGHIKDDLFEVSQYVRGLAEFIKSCVTPMTISIQGDWGSGKTSMMNMVKESLGDDVITVWFNTWQYSQFNMGDDLVLSFLGKLLQKLQSDDTGRSNETLKKAFSALKKVGICTVDHFVGGAAAAEMEQILDKASKATDDAVEALNILKEQFQMSVTTKLNEAKKDRLVVFIDDLDRLRPGKAVELLEILKIFLDCDKCVFILAIDYSVVSQGVKEKYGDLIGEDKGKSFFDKIIQVPFKMPVAHYRVDNFLINMFQQVGIDLKKDNCASVYVELIQNSVGCNPRTMKRLFNAYLLLNYVSKNVELGDYLDDPIDGPWFQKMLFSILCCQHAFEDLYIFLVRNYKDFADSNLLTSMCSTASYKKHVNNEEDGQKEQYDVLVSAFGKKKEEDIRKIVSFMRVFVKIIDRDESGKLEENEIRCFGELLNLTTITSSGNTQETGSFSEKEWRTLSRKIMGMAQTDVYKIIKAANVNNDIKPVYQSRDGSDNFGYSWAEIWGNIEIKNKGTIEFENVLMVGNSGELSLKTFVKRKRSFSKTEYNDYFKMHKALAEYGFTWQEDPEGPVIVTNGLGTITDDPVEQKNIANQVAKLIVERFELL